MGRTNKYHQILNKILDTGKVQQNKKGNIRYLLDERLRLTPSDLLDIFETHGIARKKLRAELSLFMRGERSVEKYREAGITWWDYCGARHWSTVTRPTLKSCHHSLPRLMRKSEAARITSFSLVPRTRRATRHHALAWCSSR